MMVVGSGMALADTAHPAKTNKMAVHSPESIQCSKEADAKGLHGKERKKFRAHCKKELMKHKKS
jgi:hypothetical protein